KGLDHRRKVALRVSGYASDVQERSDRPRRPNGARLVRHFDAIWNSHDSRGVDASPNQCLLDRRGGRYPGLDGCAHEPLHETTGKTRFADLPQIASIGGRGSLADDMNFSHASSERRATRFQGRNMAVDDIRTLHPTLHGTCNLPKHVRDVQNS